MIAFFPVSYPVSRFMNKYVCPLSAPSLRSLFLYYRTNVPLPSPPRLVSASLRAHAFGRSQAHARRARLCVPPPPPTRALLSSLSLYVAGSARALGAR